MKALTIEPRVANSLQWSEVPEPRSRDGELLIEALALGICGTDREIVAGKYGEAPKGKSRLIIGHESLGRVREAPAHSGFRRGQLVVGIVRHPDPEPCRSCGAGEWDMCENGRFTEHGIKQLEGFACERYYLEPDFAFPVPDHLGACAVLLEPTSVVAKAWEQIERVTARSVFRPERVLITGAGPIGLLAALIAKQRGYELHVMDRAEHGPKPELVRELGGTYHTADLGSLRGKVDIVIECTGAPTVVADALSCTGPNGVVCLAGISSGTRVVELRASKLNDSLVLENGLIFGSVNANRRHYSRACDALEQAPRGFLGRLITRIVPVEHYAEALQSRPDDIKTVLQLSSALDALR
jgi:threonine dehydrogenase-like Zn-dependent dehydrogenase